MNHFHVVRHSEDDDPLITDNLFTALDYAATELDQLADFEHDGISASGEMGDYESAYNAWVKCERYDGVRRNCLNMVKQHGELYADRAPLYAVDSADYVGDFGPALANARDAADARLLESAERIATMVNDDTPVSITHCCGEMRTWPGHDPMHGGEDYCANEYPDGYEYEAPTNTQDGPCGDH